MECPKCGGKMIYLQVGYHWDGSPAYRWRCVGEHSGRFDRCYCEVFDGEPPWWVDIYRQHLLLAFMERYGDMPFEDGPPPEDFCLQPRLF